MVQKTSYIILSIFSICRSLNQMRICQPEYHRMLALSQRKWMKGFDIISTQWSQILNRGESLCHTHESSVSFCVFSRCYSYVNNKQHNRIVSKNIMTFPNGLCSPWKFLSLSISSTRSLSNLMIQAKSSL